MDSTVTHQLCISSCNIILQFIRVHHFAASTYSSPSAVFRFFVRFTSSSYCLSCFSMLIIVITGFLLGIFSRGQNLLLCKFILLCYCFWTKFQGGAKVFRGAPPAPLWKKARLQLLDCFSTHALILCL